MHAIDAQVEAEMRVFSEVGVGCRPYDGNDEPTLYYNVSVTMQDGEAVFTGGLAW